MPALPVFPSDHFISFFKGKENLYKKMISEKLGLMYVEIRKATNAAKDITGKIEVPVNAHLQFIEKNTDFCRLFIKEKMPLYRKR